MAGDRKKRLTFEEEVGLGGVDREGPEKFGIVHKAANNNKKRAGGKASFGYIASSKILTEVGIGKPLYTSIANMDNMTARSRPVTLVRAENQKLLRFFLRVLSRANASNSRHPRDGVQV